MDDKDMATTAKAKRHGVLSGHKYRPGLWCDEKTDGKKTDENPAQLMEGRRFIKRRPTLELEN